MFIHEIFKNADPKSLAMTGESNVTYGQLEKAVENSDEEENVLLWALFCESNKQFVEAKRAFVKALIILPYF